jgi:hypothetical protein
MKRHLSSLLQHKHTEFDGGRDAHRISSSPNIVQSVDLQPKDGYDWLQQIKGIQASRIAKR